MPPRETPPAASAPRMDALAFAQWADEIRRAYPGFHVHVDSNAQKITLTSTSLPLTVRSK